VEEAAQQECEIVERAWAFLKEHPGEGSDPKEWQKRYEDLEGVATRLEKLVEKWETQKATLEKVKEHLQKLQIEEYEKALKVLEKVRKAYPGHVVYEEVAKQWLNGAERWFRQLSERRAKEAERALNALAQWNDEEAEALLTSLEEECERWQQGVQRFGEDGDLAPGALPGEVKAVLRALGAEAAAEGQPESLKKSSTKAEEAREKACETLRTLQAQARGP
jgi:tetratricopeptide (TPR) repeat protein